MALPGRRPCVCDELHCCQSATCVEVTGLRMRHADWMYCSVVFVTHAAQAFKRQQTDATFPPSFLSQKYFCIAVETSFFCPTATNNPLIQR